MLPKIDVPIFSVELISTGKKIRFRPFTVKEEKLFLMANESDDFESVMESTKQVLNNCILDEIDINTLPMFDIENIFLNLRARSIQEVINLKYNCNNVVTNEKGEEKVCNNQVPIDINLLEIKPESGNNHTNKIEITDTMGIVMKYPTFNMVSDSDTMFDVDSVIDLAVSCIDFIYDAENVYHAKDSTKEELVEFVESLQSKDMEKIKNFFETSPKIKKHAHFKCGKCGYEEDIMVEGLDGFFV